eukprot:2808603-Rhodomonas_salina.4
MQETAFMVGARYLSRRVQCHSLLPAHHTLSHYWSSRIALLAADNGPHRQRCMRPEHCDLSLIHISEPTRPRLI